MYNRRKAIENYCNKKPEQEEAELVKQQPEMHCVAGLTSRRNIMTDDIGVFMNISA